MVLALWCLPSVIIPIVQLLFAEIWFVGAVINIFILIHIGRSWARADTTRSPDGSEPSIHQVRVRTATFVLSQLVIIPALLFTTIYGFCMITGTGTF